MASLYEIGTIYNTVIDGGMVFDEDTGEVLFDAGNLEALEGELNEKLEACGLYVKNMKAEAEAIRAEEKALAERRRAKERKTERLKQYVLACMEQTGTESVETARVRLTTRQSQFVEVTDEDALYKAAPDYFVRQAPKVDKAGLRKALKEGEHIPGVALVDNCTLQVK